MSDFTDNVYEVHNSPLILAPLIVGYFQKIPPTPNNILTSYLVLPLVLYNHSMLTIQNVNITSSLHTFRQHKENLYGLPRRIEAYKRITNRCCQYAIDNKCIYVNKDLSVMYMHDLNYTTQSLNGALKAAKNLHKIFKNHNVVTIYRMLGIKKL